MLRLALLLLLSLVPSTAFAQSWTIGEQTPVWAVPPVIGDGNNNLPEVSTANQGGDPPALAYEPAAIDENGNYTRSQWLTGSVDRVDGGEAKFRLTCNFSHFARVDPILFYGQANSGHHHTFIGNKNTDHNSTYTTLRNNPGSTCAGGPLTGTAYWEPTMFKTIKPGVNVPIKPDIVTFYYVLGTYAESDYIYRLPRGLAFIGGVNPSDPTSSARLAEIPDGAGWNKTGNHLRAAYLQGWTGFACYKGATYNAAVPINPTASEDRPGTDIYSRVLVNSDGTDPWAGACDPDVSNPITFFLANITAPSCWDGHNLTSPNGRDHFRYAIYKLADMNTAICPQGWWKLPHFTAKVEFTHNGWADYQHWYLSSDRHGLSEENWRAPGSTFHFDWMNGWDSVILAEWLGKCVGVDQNGVAGDPKTCGSSTISATQALLGGQAGASPPVGGLSNDPITQLNDYARGPSKNRFGKITSGTTVSSTTVNHSGH